MRKQIILSCTLATAFLLSTLSPALAQGNSLQADAERLDITVEAQVSDPERANFEEEFTYYVVRFDAIDYERYTYREPARIGGQNVVSPSGGTIGAFWFGVSAPGADGIQGEIVHTGRVSLSFEDTEGEVHSIELQFNGAGELIRANGDRVDG